MKKEERSIGFMIKFTKKELELIVELIEMEISMELFRAGFSKEKTERHKRLDQLKTKVLKVK